MYWGYDKNTVESELRGLDFNGVFNAETREQCEAKLAEIIAEKKAEIAEIRQN